MGSMVCSERYGSIQRLVQKVVHSVQWQLAARALGGTMLAWVAVATVWRSAWTASCWTAGRVSNHLPVGNGDKNV